MVYHIVVNIGTETGPHATVYLFLEIAGTFPCAHLVFIEYIFSHPHGALRQVAHVVHVGHVIDTVDMVTPDVDAVAHGRRFYQFPVVFVAVPSEAFRCHDLAFRGKVLVQGGYHAGHFVDGVEAAFVSFRVVVAFVLDG